MKILLVDDHPMLRNGLRMALRQQPRFSVVGEASTAEQAFKLAGELTPDLVVMDIHLPDSSGIDASRRILSALPSTKVVVFSSDPSRALVDQALQAGALGYVFKTGAVEELIHAIDTVMAGRLYLSPEVSGGILEDYRKSLCGESPPAKPALSEADKGLMRLIAQGRRNKEIATQLGLSAKSVEARRSRLMKHLGCANSAELVRYAIREGIAEA